MAVLTSEEDCKYYMYRITLRENPSKDYVGITNNYKRRWSQHRSSSRRTGDRHFARAIAKYGCEAFDWKVIAIFRNGKIACEWEKIARKFLGMGYYNMTDGGEGVSSPSVETNCKRSASLRKTLSENPEQIEFRRQQLLARWDDPEYRQKMSEGKKQEWEDPEYRESMSQMSSEMMNRPHIKEEVSKRTRQLWADPLFASRVTSSLKLAWQDSNLLNRNSEISKSRWEDESYRTKVREGLQSYYTIEANIEKHSLIMKEVMNRPEVKSKQASNTKALWQECKALGFTNLKQLAEYKKTHNQNK